MVKKQQPPQSAVSFDAIIQSDRRKKQHEQLASQLLGKNRNEKGRRASAPGPGAISKVPNSKPGSLASRIAVPKRSVSVSGRPSQTNKVTKATKAKPAPATAQPTRKSTKPTPQRRPNTDRLQAALESGNKQATVRPAAPGMTIKGASGPFVVIGGNFAPGTTAADIQSAVEPISGPMLSCLVTSHHPTVTAEFAFSERWCAENAVANFHNQRADGRLLSLKLQPAGTQISTPSTSFNDLREQADRERRNRRAEPVLQDGRYGFDEKGGNLNSETGLYSDEMMVDAPQQKSQNRRRQRR
ncbi:uncharacterized protein N7496_008220 [Penicillium cataractarum]|uniref:RRM domain-containing protein n=1 Tax=Penicillium cataractarum TaxID=2100454 RepID=A0A9W9RZB3_9EURO|nr:uncharacterized protein N7496_008220 [Penicillium cataractarum]KAJ5368460.1 hypothetical protein N7496_008220 [Penicillium cataractarum]